MKQLILSLLFVALPALATEVPYLSGRVVDDAEILSPAARDRLGKTLKQHEDRTTDQIVVLTVPTIGGDSIEEYAGRVFAEWKLGRKGKDNGVLVVVAPKDRKMRIEVGYGLEGTLTDAVSRLIVENGIVPRFRANDFAGGITRGVDDIISVLTGDAEEWKQRAAKRPDTVTTSPSTKSDSIWTVIVIVLIIVVVVVICATLLGALCDVIFTILSIASSGGGRGSSGGGGFSGGGGSFGGGGASGRW